MLACRTFVKFSFGLIFSTEHELATMWLFAFLGETRLRFTLLGRASFRSFIRTSRNQPLENLENGLT